MFKITQSPTFWSTIEVEVAREEGGKAHQFKFDIEFPRLTSTQLKKFADHIVAARVDDNDSATMLMTGTWVQVTTRDGDPVPEPVLTHWKGVVDDNDVPLALNVENVAKLLEVNGVGSALCKKFFMEIGRAATKN